MSARPSRPLTNLAASVESASAILASAALGRMRSVMGISRHSAERVYRVIRRCLTRECELHSPSGGEVECDESYFGGRRKGPRGRGAAGKVPVFGLLKRDGKVYTRIVRCLAQDLAPDHPHEGGVTGWYV